MENWKKHRPDVLTLPHGRDEKRKNIKPTHSPFIVLRQDCNLIPEHKASLLSNSGLAA
jgi:hypothetical protein